MIADQACAERGCACHDYRDGPGVEMVRREWQGMTDEELYKVFPAIATYHEANKTLYRSIARAIEAKLKEKNT